MEPAGVLMLIVFPIGPLLLGYYAWQRCRGLGVVNEPEVVPAWPGVLNGSLAFALAFNIVYFVQEFFLAWPKARLPGVEATVYHNNHGWSGDHPDVLLYQGAGALAIIVLGALLSAALFGFGRRLRGWQPLVAWTACLALALGLIQLSIAAMHPENDVGQAFEHLQLSPGSRLLLAALAAMLAVVFGCRFSGAVLAMAPAGAVSTPRARLRYLLKFALLPAPRRSSWSS